MGTSGDSGSSQTQRVTKYGHICRGGSEENKLQLVDVHTRGSTEEAAAAAGGKRGGGRGGDFWGGVGEGVVAARVRSWLLCF